MKSLIEKLKQNAKNLRTITAKPLFIAYFPMLLLDRLFPSPLMTTCELLYFFALVGIFHYNFIINNQLLWNRIPTLRGQAAALNLGPIDSICISPVQYAKFHIIASTSQGDLPEGLEPNIIDMAEDVRHDGLLKSYVESLMPEKINAV